MGGYISIVGLLDGFDISINTLTFMHQQATIKGMEVGGKEDFEAMNRFIEANKIHPIIDKIFSIEQTQQAFEYLALFCHSRKTIISANF
jgi:D-arabinose 1-dehydrogenase-like Zn-dependent alcohol dehydrogenase